MSLQIKSLISQLNFLKETKPQIISCIRDIDTLKDSLNELDEMIEMTSVKVSIVNQIRFLILQQIRGKKDFEGVMLHTMITGPPGVGKTSVGLILAKIWRDIGVINGAERKDFPEIEDWKKKCEIRNEELRKKIIILGSLSNRIRGSLIEAGKSIVELNRQDAIKKTGRNSWNDISVSLNDIGNTTESLLLHSVLQVDTPKMPAVPTNVITIVSRKDFVAEYVGHTAIKTRNLLEANVGKVLFVDEAYSLVQGEKDSFGLEALSEINRFMSERPRDIIVLFAGYKDLLDRTVFTEQPGLIRRFTWSFNIEGYTPKGLSSIFIRQIESHGWSLDEGIDIEDFFTKHKDHFPGFGGDTQRFSFFCKLVYADLEFDKSFHDCIFKYEHLIKALTMLKTERPMFEERPHLMYL